MEKDGSDKNTDGLESIKERRGAKSSMAFRRKTRPPFLDNLLPLFPWSGRGFLSTGSGKKEAFGKRAPPSSSVVGAWTREEKEGG